MNSDLLQAVRAAGVVGAGGAGFPTWVKLRARPETIIVNGAECEPLLRVDQMLMARYARELSFALAAMVQDLGARRGIIALKEKYHDAYEALKTALKEYRDLEIVLLPDIYPVGDEHVLVYHVLKRPIPPGQLPLSVGAVVINVETLYNVYLACQGKPVTHKFITVSGAVRKPCTVRVPMGLPISELVQYAGGAASEKYLLINGGPCMGSPMTADEPVTKTTKGILVFPEEHALARRFRNTRNFLKQTVSLCENCQDCTNLCPRHMLGHPIRPHQTVQAVTYNLKDITALKEAALCSECGVCDLLACPVSILPREVNRAIKREMQKAGVKISWPETGAGVDRMLELRQMPAKKVIMRLGLQQYDKQAPWQEPSSMAQEFRFPLKQGAGVPASPVVSVGDAVDVGDLLADISDGIGACLHASVKGVIAKVDSEIVIRRQGGAMVWSVP